MERLFGTTMVIDEASATVKKRSFWKVTWIFLLVYFIGSMLSGFIMSVPMTVVMFTHEDFLALVESSPSAGNISDGINSLMASSFGDIMNIISLFGTLGMIAVCIYYCTKMERRRLFTMGFIKKGAIKEYLIGLLIGLVMFSTVYAILIISGQADFNGFNVNLSIPMLALFLIGFMIQGMSEEVLLRGHYFVSAAAGGNIPLAVFASSAFFAIFHLGNNGVSIMAILNIFLFGLFAAIYFLRRGSIWGIGAIHTMWNFAQGNIFGTEVSGNVMGCSVITTERVEGNTLINGGSFGPEGGLGVTIVLFIGIVILLFMKNKRVMPEIDFESSF